MQPFERERGSLPSAFTKRPLSSCGWNRPRATRRAQVAHFARGAHLQRRRRARFAAFSSAARASISLFNRDDGQLLSAFDFKRRPRGDWCVRIGVDEFPIIIIIICGKLFATLISFVGSLCVCMRARYELFAFPLQEMLWSILKVACRAQCTSSIQLFWQANLQSVYKRLL